MIEIDLVMIPDEHTKIQLIVFCWGIDHDYSLYTLFYIHHIYLYM